MHTLNNMYAHAPRCDSKVDSVDDKHGHCYYYTRGSMFSAF